MYALLKLNLLSENMNECNVCVTETKLDFLWECPAARMLTVAQKNIIFDNPQCISFEDLYYHQQTNKMLALKQLQGKRRRKIDFIH